MKRILQEPLLHFLLLGAGLFIVYGLTSKPGNSRPPGTIVVTAGQIEHLTAGFQKTWLRPPSEAELAALIDDWVRDEIATREASALGLDKDDSVIRRRLRQKLEFVSDDIASRIEPTDADLGAYLNAHPEVFRGESLITFSQVYLDPAKHGDDLARDAADVLAQLQQAGPGADLSALGDSVLLEHTFRAVPSGDVATRFGEEFAARLRELPTGRWEGPVASGYGVHLVLVTERTEGRLPDLAEARDQVRREWENARRLDGAQRFYDELLKRYTVTIEKPGAK